MKSSCALLAAALLAGRPAAVLVTDAGLKHARDAPRPGVVPPLEHVSSDKGFFGPPFPADYTYDQQPVLAKDMVRAKHSAVYPKVHENGFFDNDYVKDENGDGGEWKAQMAYDEARIKVSGEERMKAEAEERARREREAYEKAQEEAAEAKRQAEKAKKDAAEAEKEAEDAEKKEAEKDKAASENKKAQEEAKKQAEEEDAMKSEEEKLEEKVEKAEEKYEEEKKAYEECKKQYEEAKAELEELKKKLAEVEGSVNATSTNLLISANDIEQLKAQAHAAEAKRDAAKQALSAAAERTAKADAAAATQKLETAKADEKLTEQEGYVSKAKAKMEKARVTLRRIRGVDPDPTLRSSAAAGTASWLLVALLSLRSLA